MSEYLVSELLIHPVKSLRSISVSQADIGKFGFQLDRRFMFVDSSGKFITQRKYPLLSHISAEFDGRNLSLSSSVLSLAKQSFDVSEFSQARDVVVWSDQVNALVLKDERTHVISELVGVDLSLAYMPDSTHRQVDRAYYAADCPVSFADGFPFLLTNEASLKDLNNRLSKSVSMTRFRPNIVFKGDIPYQEDAWKRIVVGEVEFAVVKPCSRCVMTCIDESGVKQKEPLATLATYRRNEYGVCFGQNMVQLTEGTISIGDKLVVIE